MPCSDAAAVYRPKNLEAEELAPDGNIGHRNEPAAAGRPDSVELAKANNESQAKTV